MKFKKTRQTIKKYVFPLVFLLLIFVLIDIFLVEGTSDVRFYSVVVGYALLTMFRKIKSRITFIFCILLLAILYIRYLLLGPDVVSEETAVWLVLFFTTGVIQKLND